MSNMGAGISNKNDASLRCTVPKWRPCDAYMVTRQNLSSRFTKTDSVLEGFHTALSTAAAVALSHYEFVRLDFETPARCRHGIRVIHRRRTRLQDERP